MKFSKREVKDLLGAMTNIVFAILFLIPALFINKLA